MCATISSTAVVLNIIFNAILIYGMFGLKPMGVEGAALATLLARVAEFVWVVVLSFGKDYIRPSFKGLISWNKLLLKDFIKFCYAQEVNSTQETENKIVVEDIPEKEATCTEDGYTLHTCDNCDYQYKDNYVDATGHNYLDPVSENNGMHTYHCKDCDHSYSEGCTFVVTVVNPTYESDGATVYTCSTCGYSFEIPIPKLIKFGCGGTLISSSIIVSISSSIGVILLNNKKRKEKDNK